MITPSGKVNLGDTAEMSAYLLDCVTTPEDTALTADHLRRCSRDLAFWNQQYALAIRDLLMAEQACKKIKGTVYGQLKASGPKVTDKTAEAGTTAHPAYVQAQQKVFDSEAVKTQISGVCDAIRIKHKSLDALIRKE